MAVFDVGKKVVTLKIVYYGCALGGKTTNLVTLHRLTDPHGLQGLVSIATNDDRTLFFDLLPVDLGQIAGMTVKVKVYTVPGQVHYELTRRQVLNGADGVVMIVDSTPDARKPNTWAIENLRFNLKKNGMDPDRVPIVLQWNKRDAPNARPVAEMQAELNQRGLPHYEAVATSGAGVLETFVAILKKTIVHTYLKSGRQILDEEQIDRNVQKALEQASARAPKLEPSVATNPASSVDRRFDMDSYRNDEAERGRDRRVVDQESLLSESVNTNMVLAERLEGLRAAQALGERRGMMMEALARLAPSLTNPEGEALPAGTLKVLLQACSRTQGSLLMMRAQDKTMHAREVLPPGPDPLNSLHAEGVGTVAYQMAQATELRVVDELASEIFFGAVPAGYEGLAAVLIAPLRCDGMAFGCIAVYSQISEPGFDSAEQEFWATAASLIALSLHWRALRKKVLEAQPA